MNRSPTEQVRVLVANVDFRSRGYGRMARLIRRLDAHVLVLTELTPAWARALAPSPQRGSAHRSPSAATGNPLLRLTLDNCLVDGVVIDNHRVAGDVGSDHFPLVVDLRVPITQSGRGPRGARVKIP